MALNELPECISHIPLGLLGFAAIAFNITDQADVFKASVNKFGIPDTWKAWVGLTGRILYTITIGLCSAIFVAKLLYLIHRRKKMGFRGFGPLQVIVIMGTQCLIVPRTSLSSSSLMISLLCHCRFLRQYRWIRHYRRNIPHLQSSSLSLMGVLRIREIFHRTSQTIWTLRYILIWRNRSQPPLQKEFLCFLERREGNSLFFNSLGYREGEFYGGK